MKATCKWQWTFTLYRKCITRLQHEKCTTRIPYDFARVDDVKHKSLVVKLTRLWTELPDNCSTLPMSLFYSFTKNASSLEVVLSSFEGSACPVRRQRRRCRIVALRWAVACTTSARLCVSSSGSGELLFILLTHRRLFSWNTTVRKVLEQAKMKFYVRDQQVCYGLMSKETKNRDQGHSMVRGPPASSQCTRGLY